LIITFRGSHAALRAAREFKARDYAVELVPVPRGISSECGFCLRAPEGDTTGERAAALSLASCLMCDGVWAERETKTAEGREERRYERID